MTILAFVFGICVILLMLWLVNTYLPAPWKTPLLVIIVLFSLVWLATVFFPGVLNTRVK